MTRTVLCRKYQKELPALALPPIPGPKGQDIYEHISQQAWQDWLKHQTMLINEKHLNMMDPESRAYLMAQMLKFLSGDDYDKADGYIPESEH
jgi:Fe-S cluster biosynthesis and repair protein YggX